MEGKVTNAAKDMAFARSYEQKRNPFDTLMGKLRAFGIKRDIGIPQIVVTGHRSSGKSSVLETISGVPFPQNNTTKCVTKLVFKKSPPGTEWQATARVSWTDKDQPTESGSLNDIDEVSQKIEELTEALLMSESNHFSSESIIIEILSPDVPELTLIDLPGFFLDAVNDQRVGKKEELITKYLSQENAIILAVIPSTASNEVISSILQRVKEGDPKGVRTIGVLTMPDLVDNEDSNIAEMAENLCHSLSLGYVIVKNGPKRKAGTSMAKAANEEQHFFSTHPVFRNLPLHLFGLNNLSIKLTNALESCLDETLSSVAKEVESGLIEANNELKLLPDDPLSPIESPWDRLFKISQRFHKSLDHLTEGKYSNVHALDNRDMRLWQRVHEAGTRLRARLHELHPEFNSPEFCKKVEEEIREHRGREMPAFTSPDVFTLIAQRFVREWRHPAEVFRMDVAVILKQVAGDLASEIVPNYLTLRTAIQQAAFDLVDCDNKAASLSIEALLNCEMSPYTLTMAKGIRHKHHQEEACIREPVKKHCEAIRNILRNHVGNQQSIEAIMKSVDEIVLKVIADPIHAVHLDDSVQGTVQGEAMQMCATLKAYWDVASMRFVDECIMLVDKEMVRGLSARLQRELLSQASAPAACLEKWFDEDDHILKRRTEVTLKLERLQLAQNEIISSKLLKQS
mmetsp:Transcript_30282/g.57081  ORF Transcript_30282/g.57081 Transcript_30282/m.57081 type:complete len:684 (+) Transcript_30282:225-2276(+)